MTLKEIKKEIEKELGEKVTDVHKIDGITYKDKDIYTYEYTDLFGDIGYIHFFLVDKENIRITTDNESDEILAKLPDEY